MAYLNDKEREILPELITLVVQCPAEAQKYILGYAQAVVDFGENERRTSKKGSGAADPAMV